MVTGPRLGGLIGRQRELEQLAAAVASLGEGRGGTLLVAGSSGMGASRLLDELETRVIVGLGLPVTRLRSDQLPAWRGDPYGPVRVALERHLRTLTPARVAALVDPAAELLGPLFAGIPGVPAVDPRAADRSERRTERTLEALRALLGRLASDRPVALILEDLHEIDAATRHLDGLPCPDGRTPAAAPHRDLPARCAHPDASFPRDAGSDRERASRCHPRRRRTLQPDGDGRAHRGARGRAPVRPAPPPCRGAIAREPADRGGGARRPS